MNKKLIRKMLTASGGPLFPWLLNTEYVDNWKFRTTPASKSRVLSGKGVETDKQYTERRKKETTKRTWRSDAADVAHGIGEGILALNPYTAIPYFGAKVGLDFLNGTYGWHTALNASVPLFHLAPQAVGLREATNVALEDAANAGSKTARNWRVAREIKLATKNKPKYTRVPSKSLFRTQVYKGGEITDPYSNFVTTDPLYAANYGKVTPYIFESKSVAKAKEPMMGSSDPVTMDMFVYNNTKRNPNATAIIGHDAVTGEFTPSKGTEILNMNPKNLYPIRTSDSPTSLAFFERKPSKLTEAEKFGLNKHDRKALSINEQLALEDLALYKNSGLYRQVFRVTPDWEEFGWNLDRSNPTFMLLFVADGKTMKGPFARVLLLTPTGKGVVSWNPEKNMGGYSSRSFVTPEGLKYAPGEANMMLEGPNLKVILTSPRVDIQDFMDDLTTGSVEDLALFKSLDSQLKRTIDKDIMKDFWINSRKVQRPGSYMSGDNGRAPLGSTLIEAFKKRQLHKTPVLERPMSLLVVRRTGVSPDSYSSIIRQGNRDGSLRWGEGFTKWNNSAVENKFINDAFEQLKRGEITPEQYEGIFNKWSLEIGGRPLLWTTIQGLKIPVHPHPYIYAKKQGGKMNVLEFLKNGSGIHIKKENKGKFTDYCGGKVTSACIAKGKKSPNAAIRKRATFAANARKWKHLQGGVIFKEGTKFGLKIGTFLNSDLGKGILSLGSSLINGISNSSNLANFSNEFNNATEANIKSMEAKLRAKNYAKGLLYALLYLNHLNQNSDIHYSNIDLLWLANQFADLLFDEDEILNYKIQREQEKQQLLQAIQGSGSGFGNVVSQGLGFLGDYLGNKKTTNSSTPKLISNSTIGKSTNPYINTSLGGFASNLLKK